MGNIKLISGKGKKATTKAGVRSGAGTVAKTTTGTGGGSAVRTASNSGTRTAAGSGAGASVRPAASANARYGAPAGYRPKRTRRTGARTAFIIFIILLAGITALVVSLGFYVDSLDTVYPNVWADGIRLSGMTLEEATRALKDAGYENNAKNVSATVTFPDESGFTITGEEVGFSQSAEEAALAAFEFGREGTFLEREISYAKALLSRTDLRELSAGKFDEDLVRRVAAQCVDAFNEKIVNDAITKTGNSIIIVKGTGIKPASEEGVFELTVNTLKKALEEQTHLTVEYIPGTAEMDDIDLQVLYKSIYVAPVDSVYDPATFSATESSAGLGFDIEAAQRLLNGAGLDSRVVIPLVAIEPEITKESIESLLFRDILAEQTTTINGTSNRLNNVILSAEAVNGFLMNPGEEFSFNKIVGQRTAAKGYKEANAYIAGMTVLEIGGGICQTSSTIYDCVLHTDLQVLERSAHRYAVSYLPFGNDATINWGSIDFRFKNNTEYPIRIETEISSRKLTARLVGTKLDDITIKTDSVRISTTPFQVVEREDESVPQGETVRYTDGYTGYVVDTYKLYYDADDNLINKVLVGRSTYHSQDRITLVPPALPPGEGEPTPPVEPTDPTGEPPSPDPTDKPPVDPTGEPTAGPTDEPPETEPPDDYNDSTHEPPDDYGGSQGQQP